MKVRMKTRNTKEEKRDWDIKLRLTALEYTYLRMAGKLLGYKPMDFVRRVAVERAVLLYNNDPSEGALVIRQNYFSALEKYKRDALSAKNNKRNKRKRLPPEASVVERY